MSGMRKLKFHEQKLLKKTDFLNWKKEKNLREIKVLRRYHINDREDYVKYNKTCGQITKLVAFLKTFRSDDPFRIDMTEKLLQKLYDMGVVTTKKSLAVCEKIAVSVQAVTYVEQGHVRVGTEVVTDPSFLVTRSLEDYVTWVDGSKIKRTLMKYNDKLDDYDLLNA